MTARSGKVAFVTKLAPKPKSGPTKATKIAKPAAATPAKPMKIRPMTPGVSRGARTRAYLVGLVVTIGLVGVAMRAWALQVDDGARYRSLAERQHELRVEIPAPRGDIVDEHGRPLAVSADADSIWANPHDVRDVAATADKLAAILGVDTGMLEAKLGAGARAGGRRREAARHRGREGTTALVPRPRGRWTGDRARRHRRQGCRRHRARDE